MIFSRVSWALVPIVVSLLACASADSDPPRTDAPPSDAGVLDASEPFDADTLDAADAASPDPACASALARLQSGLDAERVKQRAPHAALGISTPRCGTQIAYSSGAQPAADADTMFRVASISKTFVSATMLLLVEQGKLSLDDRVSRWFPSFPRASEVSVRMLLNHTSGIPDYLATSEYAHASQSEGPLPSVDTRIGWVDGVAFTHEPGATWEYSNTNYLIAGRILDEVAGVGWARAIRQGPFTLAKLEHSFVYGEEEVQGTIASSVDANDIEWVGADGAVVTTPADLLAWVRALYTDRTILGPAAFEQLTTMIPVANGVGYGLGVIRYEDALTTGLGYGLGHNGAVKGYVANAMAYPEKQAASGVFLCKDQGDMLKLLDLAEQTIGQLLAP